MCFVVKNLGRDLGRGFCTLTFMHVKREREREGCKQADPSPGCLKFYLWELLYPRLYFYEKIILQ